MFSSVNLKRHASNSEKRTIAAKIWFDFGLLCRSSITCRVAPGFVSEKYYSQPAHMHTTSFGDRFQNICSGKQFLYTEQLLMEFALCVHMVSDICFTSVNRDSKSCSYIPRTSLNLIPFKLIVHCIMFARFTHSRGISTLL